MQYIPQSQPEQRFFTVVVEIALSTVLTGLTAWMLGKFKLADFVRYIPYPVIGGFLAGSELLLVLGSISLMTFVPASIYEYEWLLRPELYLHWVPGILFALILTVLLRRYSHFLVLPGTMLASIGLFYAIIWMSGTPLSSAFE